MHVAQRSRTFCKSLARRLHLHNWRVAHLRSPTLFKTLLLRQFLPWVTNIGLSADFRRRLVDLVPWKPVKDVVDMTRVIDLTSREILENKKRALEKGDSAVMHQVGEGKDIMSVLRTLHNSSCRGAT